MAWIIPLLSIASDAWSASKGASAASSANRTNLINAREQREWEKNLANTAVQRRKQDLVDAGFNPVLAATGPGASTPSVSAPTAQPTFDPAWTKGSVRDAAMFREQLLNLRANTAATTAEARSKNVEATIRESLIGQETETRANRFVEQKEWDDLKTKILRNSESSSAAEARRLSETTDAMIAIAKQQQRSGRLDLDALENVAKVGGIEASKAQGIIKLILDLYRTTKD